MRPHYSIVTQPDREPVTYGDCADHLRVDSEDDIAYVSSLIPVAREMIDSISGRASTLATWRVSAPSWNNLATGGSRSRYPRTVAGSLYVPLYRTPLVSIDAVKYYDTDNELQTMAEADYLAITHTEPGTLVIIGELPMVFDRPDAIQVEFQAGHAEPGEIPQIHRHLVKMLVHHLYEERGIISPANLKEVPWTMSAMLQHIKVGGWCA
jgi:uncharacterized phiE125 gp8 family phage protein